MEKLIEQILIIVLIVLGAGMAAVLIIYWLELDKLAIQKFEPIFRRFASKAE